MTFTVMKILESLGALKNNYLYNFMKALENPCSRIPVSSRLKRETKMKVEPNLVPGIFPKHSE